MLGDSKRPLELLAQTSQRQFAVACLGALILGDRHNARAGPGEHSLTLRLAQ